MNNKNNKKGFTLVEVIIAMGIFVLVMSSSTVIFSSAFNSYREARNILESVESSQYAMNIMAKTFRTSSVMSGGGNSVIVYDYSQEKCFEYEFSSSSGSLNRSEGVPDDPDDNPLDTCSPSGSGSPVTSDNVSGTFQVIPTDEDGEVVGKITVSMTITEGSANPVHLQTTTSLRDYVESGISL